MNPIKRREIFLRLQDANPHPVTELEYKSVFELLIAVVLSAQATDISVNAATRQLFAVANTPQTMLATANSCRVAALTLMSVACAESITAINNSKTDLYSNSVTG